MTTAVALKVVVVDYGAGNLRSVARAVAHAGYEPIVDRRPADVLRRRRASSCPASAPPPTRCATCASRGMVEPVRDYIASGRPFLGVCMGQQALLSVSEEGGEHECLGIIPGRVKKLPAAAQKVPHMGWNQVRQATRRTRSSMASRTRATSTSSTATTPRPTTRPSSSARPTTACAFASRPRPRQHRRDPVPPREVRRHGPPHVRQLPGRP